jgi:co-chaperonin GroES (HSP10)
VIEHKGTDGKTASGIILPKTAKEKTTQEGMVLAAGPGRIREDGKRIVTVVMILYQRMFWN